MNSIFDNIILLWEGKMTSELANEILTFREKLWLKGFIEKTKVGGRILTLCCKVWKNCNDVEIKIEFVYLRDCNQLINLVL